MYEDSSGLPTHVPNENVWVRCPQCDERAVAGVARVACPTCGFTEESPARDGSEREGGDGKPWKEFDEAATAVDRRFGLPYWLQTMCLGRTLWAANAEHLEYLREYITSTRRPSAPGTGLPHWITTKKHRAYVLRSLAALERRAAVAQHL